MRDQVHVVDASHHAGEALVFPLQQSGFQVYCHSSPAPLNNLTNWSEVAGVFLDLHPDSQSQLLVLQRWHALHASVPIFVTTAEAQLATVVDAVKAGAYDVLKKPCQPHDIARCVHILARGARAGIGDGVLNRLTRRERDILHAITAGATNKVAARDLGISPRTVEVHRARVMQKLGARNAADMVRIALGPALMDSQRFPMINLESL